MSKRMDAFTFLKIKVKQGKVVLPQEAMSSNDIMRVIISK
jgi:hypothetical protein